MGFLELRRQCGVSHEVRLGAQGASRVAPGKSGLLARGDGERVIALESWEGTSASRHVEERLSRSFSGCGGIIKIGGMLITFSDDTRLGQLAKMLRKRFKNPKGLTG